MSIFVHICCLSAPKIPINRRLWLNLKWNFIKYCTFHFFHFKKIFFEKVQYSILSTYYFDRILTFCIDCSQIGKNHCEFVTHEKRHQSNVCRAHCENQYYACEQRSFHCTVFQNEGKWSRWKCNHCHIDGYKKANVGAFFPSTCWTIWRQDT